jgi:hypothetical protein
MTIELYHDYKCIVDLICIDDDASTRSLLKWSNADYMNNNNTTIAPQVQITKGPNIGKLHPRPDRGKLPAYIPEPSFVADPNHRKKVLTGELIALDKARVQERATMTRMDSTRLGKNFGYMIRTLKHLDPSEYVRAGSAVLEHHFDSHEYCGDWCRRKSMTATQKEQSQRYYRSKTIDAKLYKILGDKLNRFVTYERLQEVAHGMDTQCNESFNNTASWFAPKNKVYCGSCSLTNRLSMAIGINSLGLEQYFRRLYKKLGIHLTKNVLYCLEMKNRTRHNRLMKIQTKEKKKDRIKRKLEDLVKNEGIARKERDKRECVYKSAVNMQEEDCGDEGERQQPRPKKNRTSLVCPHCGKKGHATTRSSKCLHYKGGGQAVRPARAQQLQDLDGEYVDPADDIDAMDALPLVRDPNQLDTEEDTEALQAFLADAVAEDSDEDVTLVQAAL